MILQNIFPPRYGLAGGFVEQRTAAGVERVSRVAVLIEMAVGDPLLYLQPLGDTQISAGSVLAFPCPLIILRLRPGQGVSGHLLKRLASGPQAPENRAKHKNKNDDDPPSRCKTFARDESFHKGF